MKNKEDGGEETFNFPEKPPITGKTHPPKPIPQMRVPVVKKRALKLGNVWAPKRSLPKKPKLGHLRKISWPSKTPPF